MFVIRLTLFMLRLCGKHSYVSDTPSAQPKLKTHPWSSNKTVYYVGSLRYSDQGYVQLLRVCFDITTHCYVQIFVCPACYVFTSFKHVMASLGV